MRASRAVFGLSALALPLLLGATGCNSFKYFDISVSFDPATFSSNQTGEISVCRVTVTGADQASFRLDRCPSHNVTAPLDVGVFEFSSFSDSGSNTFKIDTFTGIGEKPQCKSGEGSVTVPITSATTLMGTLKIARTGAGCSGVTTPTTDGGI